ncbi:MAG: hypothetical protein ACFFDR_08760 [Candidatus Thorarchaeota archaeon]
MEWLFSDVSVRVELGPYDDSKMGLVVKSKDIPLGVDFGSGSISAQEVTTAENIEYWPEISMGNPQRRKVIFLAASEALQKADLLEAAIVGFSTLGLEAARIPTWEIAEEIVKALHRHCKEDCGIEKVIIIASTPTQVSSLQYALDNVRIIV